MASRMVPRNGRPVAWVARSTPSPTVTRRDVPLIIASSPYAPSEQPMTKAPARKSRLCIGHFPL